MLQVRGSRCCCATEKPAIHVKRSEHLNINNRFAELSLFAASAPMAGFDPFRAITGSSGPAFFRHLNR
jgi:hypothetical protein